MRVSIIANSTSHSQRKKQELLSRLLAKGMIIDEERPDIVFSIGGDGTLLSAFHRYSNQLGTIKFVGIHTGHLGFYTDWRDYELEELVEGLSYSGKSVSYPLLDVTVHYEGKSKHFLSLNECLIRRVNGTLLGDVYIEDEFFERFRGDGLAVSTPTGSTAYNKSIGGAVIHPRVNALQLTEIASLNNRVYRTLGSPLIISNSESISIYLDDQEDYILSVDQLVFPNEKIIQIDYKIASERIHFAAHRHTNFWARVQDSFIRELKDESEELR